MTEDDQDVIEVEGQLTRDDYVHYFMWTTLRLPLALRMMAVIFVTLGLLFGAILLRERDMTALLVRLVLSLLGAVLWVLLMGRAYRSNAVKLYQTNRILQKPIRYRFGRGGLSTATPSSEERVAWSALHQVRETRDAFYPYLSAGHAYVIPKRFFESEEQIEQFRALLRESLPPEVCKV